MSEDLLLRAGTWEPVTPASAGWRYLSFEVVSLPAGAAAERSSDGDEVCLVVLRGSCRVRSGGESFELPGRADVFAGPPWSVYLPPGRDYRVEAVEDLDLAVSGAVAERGGPARVIRPDEVEIEIRGAGSATRQINHILPPEGAAHRLIVVEVYTPSGNWSSYPPHKHDEDRGDAEAVLEEIYHYRTRGDGAFGIQRLYSPRHGLDLTAWVADGDVLLVPHGYHMAAAPHAYDLYYLNALAGDRRSLAASDDPVMGWIRKRWAGMEADPRLPMVQP